MLGLAVAASCMPCQADWLNDLSLMPPVSVTMQPRNLADVDAPVLLLDALVLGLAERVLLELLTLDELLPHAASSRVAAPAPAAAAVINAVCRTISSTGSVAQPRPAAL